MIFMPNWLVVLALQYTLTAGGVYLLACASNTVVAPKAHFEMETYPNTQLASSTCI